MWQSIVDNYGERVELEPVDLDVPERQEEIDGLDDIDPDRDDLDTDEDSIHEDRFVPPAPPPIPIPPADRMIAWIGVFGSPAVLLICLIFGLSLPVEVSWILVAWFVGGFCYLVMRTPGSPRDPWDDGARV